MHTSDLDFLSRAVVENPYPHLNALREAAPVSTLTKLGGGVAVTRYEDALYVLKNPAVFSSARKVAIQQRLNLKFGDEWMRMMRSQSMPVSDPPLHTRLRGLVSGAFTPRRVAEMEPRIRAITRELVDAILPKGEFDLIEDLAAPLPVRVIAEMLGVEPERMRDFKRWSDLAMSIMSKAGKGGELSESEIGLRELRLYLEGIIAARRLAPRNDLISALIQSEQGGVLTPDDVVQFANLLLIAGNETTTNLICNGVHALLENPAEWQKLVRAPSLIPGAVEEMLRYDPPAQAVSRMPKEDVIIGGETIPAGTPVFVLVGAANRDPRRYPDPDRFDVTRDATGHLAFGHGIHFCLGAPLARLEAKVAFEELVTRMPGLAYPAGRPEHLDWLDTMMLRGLKSLRLTVGGAPVTARPEARVGATA